MAIFEVFIKGWKLLVWLGVIGGVVTFALVFYPRVSTSTAETLDAQQPLLTPFIISNDGMISLKKIQFFIGLGSITTSSGFHVQGSPDFSSLLTVTNNTIPILKAGEKYTVLFPVNFKVGDVNYANIAVIIRFKHPFLPWRIWQYTFRFTTVRSANGRLQWYPQSLSQ